MEYSTDTHIMQPWNIPQWNIPQMRFKRSHGIFHCGMFHSGAQLAKNVELFMQSASFIVSMEVWTVTILTLASTFAVRQNNTREQKKLSIFC